MTPREVIEQRLRAKRAEWLQAVHLEDREHENAAMVQLDYELTKLHEVLNGQTMIGPPTPDS